MNEADNRKKYLKIGEPISRFELSNTAEGKSPKTVLWYSEMLSAFIKYLKVKRLRQDLNTKEDISILGTDNPIGED